MRYLVIIFFQILLIEAGSRAQAPSREQKKVRQPSEAQVREQMQQAKSEAQQQITDLEKQIAEAKKNGDDPESIKEMENNLATMKKVFGIVSNVEGKSFGRPEKIPTKTYPVPKYISPIVPIRLTQRIPAPTEAQAKDRLLWYKGKKINSNTLITTSGMIVQYDRQENRVIVEPEKKKDSVFILLVNKLSKTESYKKENAQKTFQITNSFLMYPEIIKAYEEFDYIRKRYDNIAKNTIDLPIPDFHTSNNYSNSSRGAIGGPYDENLENAIGLQEAYEAYLNLLNNPPSLDFPAPPKRPSDLCLCDQQVRENYEVQLSSWSEAFWGYEDKLLSTVKKLQRFLTDNSNADISGMPNIYNDLDRGLKLAMSRKEQKVNTLGSNWGQDILREEAVVEAIVALKREKQKLGLEAAPTFNQLELDEFDPVFDRYIRNAMDAKDYNVVFDYSLYLNHEYHKQLLGKYVNVDQTRYFNWLDRLKDYNRFTLTINLDFLLHQKGGDDELVMKASGIIKSTPVIVSIGRLGCKWQLFLTNTNYLTGEEIDFRIPMKVINGVKEIKIHDAWESYPYVGPKDMLMVFPSFRFSFCQGVQDSVVMDNLRYKADVFNLPVVNVNNLSIEDGIDDVKDPGKNYTVDMLAYANKLLIKTELTKQNVNQLIDLTGDMMNFQSTIHLENPTGSSLLDQLQMEYSANLEQHKKQKQLSDLSKAPPSIVLYEAHNNSDILISEPAQIHNDEENIKQYLERGIITIKVVHTPSPRWQMGGWRN